MENKVEAFSERDDDVIIERYGLRLPLPSPNLQAVYRLCHSVLRISIFVNLRTNTVWLPTKKYTETQLFMLVHYFINNYRQCTRRLRGHYVEDYILSMVDLDKIHTISKEYTTVNDETSPNKMFEILQNRKEEKNWLVMETPVPSEKVTYVPLTLDSGGPGYGKN